MSGSSFTVPAGFPAIEAVTPGWNATVTSLSCSLKIPACAGALPPGMTRVFDASEPKLLSPGLSQNNPTSVSQFSRRSSTSSDFHFANACRYASVIADSSAACTVVDETPMLHISARTHTDRQKEARFILGA